MYLMKTGWTGTNRLLMHSEETLNPFSEIVRQMKAITSKGRKKTDEDIRLLAYLEFTANIYFDEEVGPYIPGNNIEAALVQGAKLSRLGKDVERGLVCIDEKVPVLYDGPRTVKELWDDKAFVHFGGVKVQQARVMRTRPQFLSWRLEPTIRYDPEIFQNQEQLMAIAQKAGRYTGLGDFRRRYGRFTVELLEHRAEEIAA